MFADVGAGWSVVCICAGGSYGALGAVHCCYASAELLQSDWIISHVALDDQLVAIVVSATPSDVSLWSPRFCCTAFWQHFTVSPTGTFGNVW